MTYQIILLEADIRDPMDGNMLLGSTMKTGKWQSWNIPGMQKGSLQYFMVMHQIYQFQHILQHYCRHPLWRFKKITDKHHLITDVFQDHQITIDLDK
jgi:hypothetical protein